MPICIFMHQDYAAWRHAHGATIMVLLCYRPFRYASPLKLPFEQRAAAQVLQRFGRLVAGGRRPLFQLSAVPLTLAQEAQQLRLKVSAFISVYQLVQRQRQVLEC